MNKQFDFDAIRPYRDNEVHDVIESLLCEPALVNMLSSLFPDTDIEAMKSRLRRLNRVQDFQCSVINSYLRGVEKSTSDGIHLEGIEGIKKDKGYIMMSNHRDIILDSAFLNISFMLYDIPLTEIAIGDNLLIYDWIRKLVRLNRSFIVERNLGVREQMASSMRLSAYIRDTIANRNRSIWIAQREGRAKDSNDRTQVALLKMFNMSADKDFASAFHELNISPLTISYEYDPCDYLKAKEFQQKRDNPDFKKQPGDDLLNMKTGVMGWKGKVCYCWSGTIDREIDEIASVTSVRNEQLGLLAEAIDRRIHLHYTIFANNMVAYDELFNYNRFASRYSADEKKRFDEYLDAQLAKIDIPSKDETFLRAKMLEMYANPLINKLRANNE